jgi:actin-related protein
LVIDVGLITTRILAICHGIPVLSAYRELPWGGRHIDFYIAATIVCEKERTVKEAKRKAEKVWTVETPRICQIRLHLKRILKR